jgi:excisionase family DNA binding protein
MAYVTSPRGREGTFRVSLLVRIVRAAVGGPWGALSPLYRCVEAHMIVMDGEEFLTAQEACQLLGVKASTLYAYVSRGLLTSYRQGIKRARLYLRSDVEDLTRLRGPGEIDARGSTSADADRSGSADDQAWIPYL